MARNYTLDDVERLVRVRGGSLTQIPRRGGISFLYSYSINGEKGNVTFGLDKSYKFMYETIQKIQKLRFKQKRKFSIDVAPRATRLTFLQILQWYLETHQDFFSPEKMRVQRYAGSRFQEFLEESRRQRVPADKLTLNDLAAYEKYLSESKIASGTIYSLLYRLRLIFEAAIRAEKIGNFPFPEVQQNV